MKRRESIRRKRNKRNIEEDEKWKSGKRSVTGSEAG